MTSRLHAPRHRFPPARWLPARRGRPAGLVAAVTLLAGCTGGAALETDVAERLAGHSDALAAALEAGDGCNAHDHADELLGATRAGLADGTVPSDVAERITTTTEQAVVGVDCEPAPSPQTAPEPEHEHEDEDEDTEKRREKAEEQAEKEREQAEKEREKAEKEREKAEKEAKEQRGEGDEHDEDD